MKINNIIGKINKIVSKQQNKQPKYFLKNC